MNHKKFRHEFPEFSWVLEITKDSEKIAETCHVQGNPCPIFQNQQKTLVKKFARIRIHNFLRSSQNAEKFEKAAMCRGTPARFSKNVWKHLQNFSSLISQKVFHSGQDLNILPLKSLEPYDKVLVPTYL